MEELLKTVLILSSLGFGITLILLILKPITSKKLPAFWQYAMWLVALFSMVVPTYKLIPKKSVENLSFTAKMPQREIITTPIQQNAEEKTGKSDTVTAEKEEKPQKTKIDILKILCIIWILGMGLFLITVFASYVFYVCKKRKNSVKIENSEILKDVKHKLKIKRKIRFRASEDIHSPLLVGVFFPTVYVPKENMQKENMQMILLHELTHYKRKDLFLKWAAVFVNAVHWFNPLCYIVCINLSEACEIACDVSVTKNMSNEEKKLYMNTILTVANRKGE